MQRLSYVHIRYNNPLITNETDDVNKMYYMLICTELKKIPTITDFILDVDRVKMQVRGKSKTYKYPKKGMSIEWVLEKIRNVDDAVIKTNVRANERKEEKETPEQLLGFCKLCDELIPQGATLKIEEREETFCINPRRLIHQLPAFETLTDTYYTLRFGTFFGRVSCMNSNKYKVFKLKMDAILQRYEQRDEVTKLKELAKQNGLL